MADNDNCSVDSQLASLVGGTEELTYGDDFQDCQEETSAVPPTHISPGPTPEIPPSNNPTITTDSIVTFLKSLEPERLHTILEQCQKPPRKIPSRPKPLGKNPTSQELREAEMQLIDSIRGIGFVVSNRYTQHPAQSIQVPKSASEKKYPQ